MSDWSEDAVDYLQAIADTKLVLGHRYAERLASGQSIEDDVANMNVAQEEFGHVRQLFSVLEEQGRSREWLERDRDAGMYASATVLEEIDPDWTAFIVRTGMADRAAWLLLDAIEAPELEGIQEKIAQEESFHLERADGWFEHLLEREPENVQAVLEEAIPEVLGFIGPATYDESSDPLYGDGFTDTPISEVREQFLNHYRALCADSDVEFDSVATNAPDPAAWDEVRRREHSGSLSPDTVSIIQGTPNREFAAE